MKSLIEDYEIQQAIIDKLYNEGSLIGCWVGISGGKIISQGDDKEKTLEIACKNSNGDDFYFTRVPKQKEIIYVEGFDLVK